VVAGLVFLGSATAFVWLLFSSGLVKVGLPEAPAAEASPAPSARPWVSPSPAARVPATATPAARTAPTPSPAAAKPVTTPRPAPPRPSAAPSVAVAAGPATPEPPGSRIAIDFDHPLREGNLQVWVDGKLTVDEDLLGQADRKLGIKTHKGSLDKTVAVRPGLRTVRVRVAWDDNAKEETVSTTFKAGQARRLEIRLGRIRKNLSVEWK
jgi:hypothetical protein